MPTYTEGRDDLRNLRGGEREYATEAELLAFANKVREAGGAEALEALLPSGRMSNTCLIATALNFTCRVYPREGPDDELHFWPSGAWQWTMLIGDVLVADRVAEACDLERLSPNRLLLPERIGNTARAYDLCEGWTTRYNAER